MHVDNYQPRAFLTPRPHFSVSVYIEVPHSSCVEVALAINCLEWDHRKSVQSVHRDRCPSSQAGFYAFVTRFDSCYDAIRFCVSLQGRDNRLNAMHGGRARYLSDAEAELIRSESVEQWNAPSGSPALLQRLSSAQTTSGDSRLHNYLSTSKKKGGVRDRLTRRFNRSFWELVEGLTPEEYARCSEFELAWMAKKKMAYHSALSSTPSCSSTRRNF
jgi:hypothetical protein